MAAKGFLKSSTIRWLLVAAVATVAPGLLPITEIILPEAGTVDPVAIDQTKQTIQELVEWAQHGLQLVSLLMAAWGRANPDITPISLKKPV